ncbi:hypothetical protein NJB18091_14890 [Mycobacterium marinum]|nr:hypothetical protein NJB1507_26710 [Mycobacterium marinum]GJP28741.1 hypothetical protein NJB18091_14890 [Mycobacterium marinum]
MFIHARYGNTAASIDSEAGPSQPSPVSTAITVSYAAAVERNSAASPSQAVTAASIGAEPGPEYMRIELISGGSAAKSISNAPYPAALDAAIMGASDPSPRAERVSVRRR